MFIVLFYHVEVYPRKSPQLLYTQTFGGHGTNSGIPLYMQGVTTGVTTSGVTTSGVTTTGVTTSGVTTSGVTTTGATYPQSTLFTS